MKRKRKSDIKVEFIEGREMTEAELETYVQILFQWWKRDFEAGKLEPELTSGSGRGSQA